MAFLEYTAGKGLTAATLTKAAKHYMDMLQLSSVASTITENGYVDIGDTDYAFFLELVYVALTGSPAAQMHVDVQEYQFVNPRMFQTIGDPKDSLTTWAAAVAAEISTGANDTELQTELGSHGAHLVLHARIVTCEACGDRKGAERVRAWVRRSYE